MTTKEVAEKLVAYCRTGQFEEAYQKLYDPNILSIEPEGSPSPEVRGMEAVLQKSMEFANMLEEMHGMKVSDPIVAENFFCCSMNMDVTFKGMGRTNMEELCMYEVKDGKIVKEQFFFTPVPQPA